VLHGVAEAVERADARVAAQEKTRALAQLMPMSWS